MGTDRYPQKSQYSKANPRAIAQSTPSQSESHSGSSLPAGRSPSVDRVQASSLSSQQFCQHYLKPGMPLIVEGLLAAEPDWNLDYLCETLGQQVVPIRQYGRARYQQDKRLWTSVGSGVSTRNMTFAEYADYLKTGVAQQDDLYLGRTSIKDTPLDRQHHLHEAAAWFKLSLPVTYFGLWVGAGQHTSCLHYDPMDGLLMQLHGAKKVLLFPPSQTYNLYPIPVYKQLRYGLKLRAVYSQVYPETPDFESFPNYAAAVPHRMELVLNPGDILFLPAGWWHEVTTLGDGVVCSINRFWNVWPLGRALRSWNKWRAHLASLLAAPHIAGQYLKALSHADADHELKKLIQRL